MKKKLEYLVIHCTATPAGRAVGGADIRRWHCSPVSEGGRGWSQVGYSDLIHINGAIENLVAYNDDGWVDPWEITNGAAGVNSISRHVVYAGGVDAAGQPADTRTKEQKRAMRLYVEAFRRSYPDAKIIGHNELCGKACPSFDVQAWLKTI
jgi:hypothetical protein